LDFLRCRNPFQGFVLEASAVEEGNKELLGNIGYLLQLGQPEEVIQVYEDVMPI
jgi:hypothetical protein